MKNTIFLLMSILVASASCKKLVDVASPEGLLVGENVFKDTKTAAAVMSGIYSKISSDGSFVTGSNSVTYLLGLYADELLDWSAGNIDQNQFYKNALSERNTKIGISWSQFYNTIFTCNSVIEGLEASKLSGDKVEQIVGEAKFTRALQFFYLVNMWGNVPVPTSTNYKDNRDLKVTLSDSIYSFIISDLKSAKSLLSEDFLSGDLNGSDNLRVRPSKWAASALLARVYLYVGDYKNAEIESSFLIGQNQTFALSTPATTFLIESRETIWQIKAEGLGLYNSLEGYTYLLPNGVDYYHSVSLDSNLVKRFTADDLRRSAWIGEAPITGGQKYYYSNKYKNGNYYVSPSTEFTVVLRLAEQYLIRAEARLLQGNISGSEDDLNTIRIRAGLAKVQIASLEQGKSLILAERQLELFLEFGHRWLDLRRQRESETLLLELAARKVVEWQSFKRVFPIPRSELDVAKNLLQNTGY